MHAFACFLFLTLLFFKKEMEVIGTWLLKKNLLKIEQK